VSVTFKDSQHIFQTPGGQSLTSHCPPARLSRYKSCARVAAFPTFAPRCALGLNRGNLSRWLVQTCAACHRIAKDFITPRTIAGGDGILDWDSNTAYGTFPDCSPLPLIPFAMSAASVQTKATE
jgi:hypothetical protein